MRCSLWLWVVLSVGCASTRYVHLPDGSRGQMVSCSGREKDWGDCMNQAHRACDGKYQIVERYDERDRCGARTADAVTRSVADERDRRMLVTCAR